MPSFWRGPAIQWRVVGALIIREIYTRFGPREPRFCLDRSGAAGVRDPGPVCVAGCRAPTSMAFRSYHFCGADIFHYCCSVISAAVYCCSYVRRPLLYHQRVTIFRHFSRACVVGDFLESHRAESYPFGVLNRIGASTHRAICRCSTWAIFT